MDKNKLYKALGILAVVILGFSALSRILSHNSMTLAEYAAKNSTQETEQAFIENDTPGEESSSGEEDLLEESASEVSAIFPDRVIYAEDFFYEPLSDEMKAFITGISYPNEESEEIPYEDLHYVHILHYNFDGEVSSGELICNKAISRDLIEIFYELYSSEYAIEKIRLMEHYDGDDILSMEDNNTSCFNYRQVSGSGKLSQHALGLAIDINPLYNPHIVYNKDGSTTISPESGTEYAGREKTFPYKIDESDLCYRLFTEKGFTWGGNWNSSKDYQHFQKKLP